MANFCKTKPNKGTQLFDNLRKLYDYRTAWRLWALSSLPSFKEGKSFRYDSEGYPLAEDLIKDEQAIEIMGEEKAIQGIAKQFPQLSDTRENYARLIQEAQRYNSSVDNKKYIAIVEHNPEEYNKLWVSIQRRTQQTEDIANEQYSTQVLNERLTNALQDIGISIDNITEAEEKAGRVGVTDFQRAKTLAEDCISMVRIANNQEGFKALSEEFSHLLIGAYHDEAIIQRALDLLLDEDVLKSILGDEYDAVHDFQNGDIYLIAEEALGKLLRENLLAQTMNKKDPLGFVVSKIVQSTKSKFRRVDAERIQKAITDANSIMGQLAKDFLNNQIQLKRDKVALAERNVQFNALSDRIQANIDILKQLKSVEMKRLKIMSRTTADEIKAQKDKIYSLSEFTQNEKDTRIGICNYGLQAIQDLKDIEESMSRRTYTGTPSFATLRRARSYIQSYAGFIKDMRNAIIDAENDEKVPDFLTDIELEDGRVISMSDIINQLDALSSDLTARYNKYARSLITEFFRPFFGDSITFTTGSHKGEKLNIEAVIEEASKDISFLDMWLDSMGDSSDVFLQLFDAVAKKSNDNARLQTIKDSKEITRLWLIAEENGITDYEWMFEKDGDGRKTGNYIGEYNIGLFQQEKAKFIKSLNKRYGERATGENARMKIKELRDWIATYADAEDPNMPKQIERWLNKDYAAAMTDSAKKELYEGFLALKWKADTVYPDNRVSPLKAIQRRKSTGNRIIDSIANPSHLMANLKEATKQYLLEAEDDDQLFGNKKTSLTNFDGTEYMTLPVLYTNRLKNPDDLSTDIFADLLIYKYSANLYDEMDKIIDPLETARDYVVSKQRKVVQTRGDNTVVERLSALGEKMENKIYKGDSNIERKLNEWMESHIYQRYIKDEGSIDVGIAKLSKSKLGSAILSMSSMASLGLNFLANSANVATGLAMTNIEAVAGQFFNASQLRRADSSFASYLPSYMAELGSRNKTNFLALFDEFFNIKGEYGTDIKRNQRKSLWQKLFGSNILFLGQNGGDFWLYNRCAIAHCMNIQVLVPKVTKTIKKIKGLKAALDTIDKIVGNSENMVLTEDEKQYNNLQTGRQYARVTSVISNNEDSFSEAWRVPSTNIGTGIDNLVRDFFAGLLVKDDTGVWHHDNLGDNLEAIYPNVNTDDMYAFFEQLSALKQEFDKKGLSVVSRGITARGKLKINDNGKVRDLDVAGTLDLLVYDKEGNFYIYDMKTHRSKVRNTTKNHWAKQLSLYKRFLEEEYGITVKGLNIIPIQVHYDTPEGEYSNEGEGHAKYEVEDGTNQLRQNGEVFKGAKPNLEQIIPLQEVKKIPIEYDNLGYNKQYARTTDTTDFTQMSLFEALQINNVYSDRDDIKEMVLPEGTLDSEGVPISIDKVSREIQDIGHKLFGIYNDEDSNVANRLVMGRALQQFRKWIKPQFNHRFQKAQINIVTGRTEEGYYRTFGKYYARKFLYNFMNEALRGKVQIAAHWNELEDEEKVNIKRAWTEIIQYLCVCLLVNFAPWPDDKKRPWILKYAEYMAQREKHELGGLVPSVTQLQELSKTIQSPIPAMTQINRMISLMDSLLSPEDYLDEKQSGPYKGMSTLEANFLKAPLPVVSWWKQIDKFGNQIDTSINFYARPSN